jgi:hypothetical protein
MSDCDHFQKEDRVPEHREFPAFVRAPEGNGCAERFIRTLKENLLWVRDLRNDRRTPTGTAGVPPRSSTSARYSLAACSKADPPSRIQSVDRVDGS